MANAHNAFDSGAVRIEWGGYDGEGICLISAEMKGLLSQVMGEPLCADGPRLDGALSTRLRYPMNVVVWPTEGLLWRMVMDGQAELRKFNLAGVLTALFTWLFDYKISVSFSRTPGFNEWLLEYVRFVPDAPPIVLQQADLVATRQAVVDVVDDLMVAPDVLRIATRRVLGLL